MELTDETIQATRQWFADNARACIEGVASGKYRVNDPIRYAEQHNKRIVDALSGAYDHSLAFQQRAVYIQTGQCFALLT